MMDWTRPALPLFPAPGFLQCIPVLYTEMITTGALLHGNVERHLAFSAEGKFFEPGLF